MRGKYLNRKEIKKVMELLDKQWGFSEKIDYIWFLNNRRKLYIITKDFATIDETKIRVNTLGMYFGEMTMKGDLRLSIEGAQLIGQDAKKQVLRLNDDQLKHWMYGNDVAVADDLQGFHILMHHDDIVGCGSCKEGTLFNHVSKNRRIKTLDMPS